jgi:hypothetical protein
MNKEQVLLHYQETHKEVNGIIYKQCSICKEWFLESLDNFYKNNKNLSPYCKECEKAKSKKYSQLHNDQRYWYNKKYLSNADNRNKINKGIRERQSKNGTQRKWQQKNKGKLKVYQENRKQHGDHRINKKEWEDCKKYFDNCCAYCGLPIEKHYNMYKSEMKLTDFHKEHIDHEGSNDLSNCVPSCKTCNSSKRTQIFEDWYNESNQIFSQERLDKIHKWLNEDYKIYIESK